jgi:hypothetical protein
VLSCRNWPVIFDLGVDTCRSPRAIFAGNQPLECGHLSIMDCGHFFPVALVVKNLSKVDSHLILPHFRHCFKNRKRKYKIQRSEKCAF